MRLKIHWRQVKGRWHGFQRLSGSSSNGTGIWYSLCGRHELTKLGDGKSLKDIHPWALCGACDGLEQEDS